MVDVRRIDPQGPVYDEACRLRSLVLLEPLGYSFERFCVEYPSADRDGSHFVALLDHPRGPVVVGTAILIAESGDSGVGKVMQVAVDPQRRGEGIGTLLMVELERFAFGDLGLRELYCHAQLSAVGFYDSLGWYAVSEIFEEAGIEHRRMRLRAPDGGM